MLKKEGEVRIPSGCAIAAIIDRTGERFDGTDIIDCIALMHDRSNGLGGGFAAYGIYPDYEDLFAFHIFYDDNDARIKTEEFLFRHFDIENFEQIPTRKVKSIHHAPLIWRYFGAVPASKIKKNDFDEDEYTARCVIKINNEIDGAFVFSSGKIWARLKPSATPRMSANIICLKTTRLTRGPLTADFPRTLPAGGAARTRLRCLTGQ